MKLEFLRRLSVSAYAVTVILMVTYALVAEPALASDGIIEINHSAAMAGGITPSDGVGYPVTLDTSGSYELTGNLTVPGNNTSAIRVLANDVSIELNGFHIAGTVICTGSSGAALVCTGGSGNGAVAGVRAESVSGTLLRGGFISGFNRGAWLGANAVVGGLVVSSNEGNGIRVGAGSSISHNIAMRNGASGIDVGAKSSVIENLSYSNAAHGVFYQGRGGLAATNVVALNGFSGLYCRDGCTTRRNLSSQNTTHGLRAGVGSLAEGNLACDNGLNQLNLGVDSGYVNNSLVKLGSNSNPIVSGGTSLGPNLCASTSLTLPCN